MVHQIIFTETPTRLLHWICNISNSQIKTEL